MEKSTIGSWDVYFKNSVFPLKNENLYKDNSIANKQLNFKCKVGKLRNVLKFYNIQKGIIHTFYKI